MQERLTQHHPDFARAIVAVGRGDRAAFAALFEHFAPRIKTMMARAGLSDQRAEDLAQETMLAVWRKAQLFDPAGAGAAAWIYTIARNLRIDALRKERRTRQIEGDAMLEPAHDQPLPDAEVSSLQWEDKVRSSLADLGTDQLQVVRLSYFENKSHPEIAQALGIPLGTVKSRLRLAIKRLRALLDDRP